VVSVHGAGWQVSDSWNSGKTLHCLSLSGFAVIAPNFRGSTGYGSEFMKSIVGDPGGGDLNDVLSAAEWLRGQKDIQATKIAVSGGSYGGYLALMALTTKPDAFAAGVSIVPVTDWLASIRLSDAAFMSFYEEIWGGLTASKEGLIRSRSPIAHVSKIKAPVLIKGAETDVRCPIQPIKEFVEELKKIGHPHEFILEKKEGHMSTAGDLKENIREVKSVIGFLNGNLT
jgi:dipeptidyl aminopeptidase/acylaminoacyl peptidase